MPTMETALNSPEVSPVDNDGTEQDKINLNAAILTESSPLVQAGLDTHMGMASNLQFAAIAKYLQPNHGTTAGDWFVFCAIASDNLVNRSYRKWHTNILDQMAARFPGSAFQLDHAWESIDANIGFIFDARHVQLDQPIAEAINQPGKAEHNQKIADTEGHHTMMVWVAVPMSDQGIVDSIKTRKYQFISTGGWLQKVRMICPNCTADSGREVSFTERDKNGDFVCPHTIPSLYSNMFDDDDEDSYYGTAADYLVLDGTFDSIEVSLVMAGSLPYAQVVR